MGSKKPTTWEGGTIRYGEDGTAWFRLEKMIQGVRYRHSLPVHDIHAARAHWDRFQANPAGFSIQGEKTEGPAALPLSADLVEKFLTFSRDKKSNTEKWVKAQKTYLADWTADLHGIDLRSVSVHDHIKPALKKRKSEKPRIEVIKAFYAWLRTEEHKLTHKEDPTLDLKVPQSDPEKHRKFKIIPKDHVMAARDLLEPKVRDGIDLILATAWHGTELQRFADEGKIVERPKEANLEAWPKGVAAVLEVKQKTGGVERWSVSKAALAAAKRVKANGVYGERWINRSIEKACADATERAKAKSKKAEPIPAWTYGPLRHSVLTWAREAGASLEAISKDLAHHKDQRTTERFYIDVKVPQRIPTVI